MKTIQKQGLCAAVFVLALSPVWAGGGPGQASFERAYRIEKRNPEMAVHYYRQALTQGLNRELRKAAKWRLFYLYKDLGQYDKAMSLARELGASQKARSMEHDLVREVSEKLGVDRKTAELYIQAIDLIESEGAERLRLPAEKLRRSLELYPRNNRLLRTFTRAAIKAKNRSELRRVFADCPRESCRLSEIRLLIEDEEREQAKEQLYRLARKRGLLYEHRASVLHLLARIYRDEGQTGKAVDAYRLASNYARGKRALYYRALAAFALYEAGYKRQAADLLYGEDLTSSFSLHILDLILQADLNRSRSAYRELQSLESKIRQKIRRKKSVRLMQRALQILERGIRK